MFLRIVINSLKRKRLMNITLFIFIFLSAIIICTAVSEIYSAKVGLENTFTVTNTVDETLIKEQPASICETVNAQIEK